VLPKRPYITVTRALRLYRQIIGITAILGGKNIALENIETADI
jgi:hypothetical protein